MLRVRVVTIAIAVAALAAAAPATAKDFCVAPATGCDGGQQATLQGALDAALASTGPDTVRLPAGTVQGPGTYSSANPDNTVAVVGAGRDATIVTSSATGAILDLENKATLTELTVRQASPVVPGQNGAFVAGTAERVAFVSVDTSGTTAVNGTARSITASGPATFRINGTIEDSQLAGGGLYTGTSVSVVRRVKVVAPAPLSGQDSSLVVSSSLFVSTTAGQVVAYASPPPVSNVHATVVLSNVTLIGAGGSCIGLFASGNNIYPPPDDFAVMDMTLGSSIVRGCPTTVRRDSGGGNRRTDLRIFSSDLDLAPAAVQQSGSGTLTAGPGDGNVNTDPLFVGLAGFEQALGFASPVLDKGLMSTLSPEESATDLTGAPRIVDGDGSGTATRDMGAFEYQRRAPAVTASADPTSAARGQSVTFTGSATDADPGETITGYTWRFDDGDTAAGQTVSHAFAAPGAHSATLTATDSAGVGGTATATVTVAAPVVPAVQSVTLSRATFRAAARGSAIAAAKKRAPVGTKVTLALSAPAAVTLTIQRRTTGRTSGSRCVATTKRNKSKRRCTRHVTLRGSVTRASGAPATFTFSGRWSRRKLAPGRYRFIAQAATTPAKSAPFRIVR